MDLNERTITFEHADRRYADLKRQHEVGAVSDEGFEEQLKQLMVLDDQSRWWAKSRSTGEWHYYDGTDWVIAEPPYEQSQPSQEPGTNFRKPSYDELVRICAKYDGPHFYVGESIPRKRLARARASFAIPAGEDVAALLETTSNLIGMYGLAVCEEGLRWRNDEYFRSGRYFIGWSYLSDASIYARWRHFGQYDLEMGEGVLRVDNKPMEGDQLVRLLHEIQSSITASPTE
jgi:hypothetical protein